jgi:hypothetical protein
VEKQRLIEEMDNIKGKAVEAREKGQEAREYANEAQDLADDVDTMVDALISEVESEGIDGCDKQHLHNAEVYQCVDRLYEFVETIDDAYKENLGQHVRTALRTELTIIESLFALVGWKRP